MSKSMEQHAKEAWPNGYTEVLDEDGHVVGYISASPNPMIVSALKVQGRTLGETHRPNKPH